MYEKLFSFLSVHDVQPYSSSQFNLTHVIRHLSFGINIPGKTNHMDNTTIIATEGRSILQYVLLKKS